MSAIDLDFFAVSFLLMVGGLAIGLYLGERGRRQALERQAVYGHSMTRPAVVTQASPEPEARLEQLGRAQARGRGDEFGVSEATVKRGVKAIQQMAKQAGHPVSDEEARAQVEAMLHPDAGFELPEHPL